jgi:4-diphosphocytidyl-2-C-methyl-D-erythritol kinase
LLRKKFKLNKGVDIIIKKNIPVGAGLGGGSGNAATVLMGLNKLWKLNISKEKLKGLGAKIGSDVAFFIYETPFAQGLGRGEKIRPIRALNKIKLWHVLVVPKLCVSTPLIYSKFDLYSKLTPQKQSAKLLISALKKNLSSRISENLFNSLEAITIRLYPKVQLVKFELEKLGVRAILMSGSGSAVFGIVTSRKEALNLYRKLAKNRSLGWVFIARTV